MKISLMLCDNHTFRIPRGGYSRPEVWDGDRRRSAALSFLMGEQVL